jgi:hypothetical protein
METTVTECYAPKLSPNLLERVDILHYLNMLRRDISIAFEHVYAAALVKKVE